MATKAKRAGESSTGRSLTVPQLRERLLSADAAEFAVLKRAFASDTRKGVVSALAAAERRLEAEAAESHRIAELYRFQTDAALRHCGGSGLIVGLDEVGRGPVAGPLCVGAVVLPDDPPIAGLNDSKQIPAEIREGIADQIKHVALAWDIEFIEPAEIDAVGMSACLTLAFRRAIAAIDSRLPGVSAVLLDGNPLRCDPREINIVKGDAKAASIAAASIIAKVERDALMVRMAERFPQYGFDSNKGYASAAHIEAIRQYGLCEIHRVSFCASFAQETLF